MNEKTLRKIMNEEISLIITKLEKQAVRDSKQAKFSDGVPNSFFNMVKTVEYLRVFFLELVVQYGSYLFGYSKYLRENKSELSRHQRKYYFEIMKTFETAIHDLTFLGDQISKPYTQEEGLKKILGEENV